MLAERLFPRWSSTGLTPFLGKLGQCGYFYATPTGGRLATTYDLACNRPHTRRIFSGIGFRTLSTPATLTLNEASFRVPLKRDFKLQGLLSVSVQTVFHPPQAIWLISIDFCGFFHLAFQNIQFIYEVNGWLKNKRTQLITGITA
ncbi:hypothetical protein AVEN_212617-1 [Araneus ventricosus]|uniref:Uncharacterized protein n=1 Tax=Araneus ventricosus TaxID=182803 RepID=A0A4Y2U932_ARAVE|nr:hypothetical protein AVEN_84466-1 [Araneus ventricosus]GBO09519.1 hypothetical protein AVEN_212617-1 [Araneus ventricosus]